MAIVSLNLESSYRTMDLVLALASILTDTEPHSQVQVAVCKAELNASLAQMVKDLNDIPSVPDLALLALRNVLRTLPEVGEVSLEVN